MAGITYGTEAGCINCGTPPGKPHSLACADPDEFARRETEREGREYEAQMAAARLASARREVETSMEIAQDVAVDLVAHGVSEVKAAQMVGIDRMTLRKALGKQ